MTLQLGEQTITVHIMPNISQSEGNYGIKFGQLIEYNKINNITISQYFSPENVQKNLTGRLLPDLFLLFQEALHKVNASGLQLSFNILG